MYDPKGGDKPAYDPQYPKPPVEEPPQENPTDYPTDQQPPGNGQTCDPPTGDCTCPDWEIPNCPTPDVPFRRLLQKLEDVLEELSEKPTDATKKFADDLKDADKEYTGITALVAKYKDFYDKLPCRMAEVANWRKELVNWTADKPTPAEKDAIKTSRNTDYEDKERQTCCDWIQCREYYNSMLDCFEQSKKKEEEAKENYDTIKGLEKLLGDRFTELKALFEKAKAFNEEERYRAVYAVYLEFGDVFAELSVIRDWVYARQECGIGNGGGTGQGEDPIEVWKPEKFKAEVVRNLRALLMARFQRFRWQHDVLTRSSENQKKKDLCEKFRKERRDKFIQESEDIEAAEGNGGGEPGKGYGEEPTQAPEYPGGQNPDYPTPPPPTPGDYPSGEKPDYPTTPPPPPPPPQQKYPGGQNPEYPPPTQQYQGGQQPEYPETPPPAPQSRGRQKS